MKKRTNFKQVSGLLVAALLLTLAWMPTTALAAATPVGTVITNQATVTWNGTESTTASATVTVTIAEVAPLLDWVDTQDSSATSTTTVPESEAMTITYNLTSQSNGFDTYDLTSTIAANAVFDATPSTTVPATVTLGATVVVSSVVSGSDTIITIPSPASGHGLVANVSNIVIGTATGTTYSVTAVDDAGPYTITITGTPALSAGDLIGEQKQFTVTFTTDTLVAPNTTGDHVVTTEAAPDGDAAKVAQHIETVTVVKAALTLTKTANGGASTTAAPGEPVTYSITATNGGSTDASTVTIIDPIQAFTTFAGAVSTTPAADSVQYSESGSGGPWLAAPTSNDAVTHIQATWNTLSSVAPNNTANLTFNVTVD